MKVSIEKIAKFFYAAGMEEILRKRRSGPSPFPVHMGMAASNLAGSHQGVHQYTDRYQVTVSEKDLVRMMHGIKMYQESPYEPIQGQRSVVWEYDTSRIFKTPGEADGNNNALLLIPSLVNKADILDLPHRSFMRWMQKSGIPTYLFDWGDLTKSKYAIDIEEIIEDRLVAAVCHVSKMEGRKVNILGYCMGGILSLATALHCQEEIEKIVLLATPWDFHIGHPALSERVRLWSPMVLPVIEQKGMLPAIWTQALFASLDPQDVVQKFSKFAAMDQSTHKARLFIEVEDWLNDGCDLPGAVATHFLREWFAKNSPAKGNWCIGGKHIDISKIKQDVLVVASDKDRLVPLECATKIIGQLPEGQADLLSLHCGHVGFIAGRDAMHSVWEPIRDWLEENFVDSSI